VASLNDGVTRPATQIPDARYFRLDSVEAPEGILDLSDGVIDRQIHINEFGNTMTNTPVWTRTFINAVTSNNHCLGWTSANGADSGTGGNSSNTKA
jgi:hypothetical protein